MKTLAGLFALAALAYGQPPTKQKALAPPQPIVTASDAPSDVPEFRRKYAVMITSKPGISLTVECKDFISSRWCLGTLRQISDEKSVTFDLEYDIAERIFDSAIVPEVQKLSRQIRRVDADYRASNPQTFKDKDGTRWAKQAK